MLLNGETKMNRSRNKNERWIWNKDEREKVEKRELSMTKITRADRINNNDRETESEEKKSE